MGYMRNHTIVVSDHGWGDDIVAAHTLAKSIFPWVSPISVPATNNQRSFFIPPDGSKEGWPDSDEGNVRRKEFIDWLTSTDVGLEWIEVQFGDDEGMSAILRHSDENRGCKKCDHNCAQCDE